MIRAILFDFDGTLVPSLPAWHAAYSATLSDHGVELSFQEVIDNCFYRPYADVCLRFKLSDEQLFSSKMNHYLAKGYGEVSLFDGAMTLLQESRAAGLRSALVTSANRHHISTTLDRLSINGLFDVVVTADDVINLKPDAEPVEKAVRDCGVGKDEAVMIGDSHADIVAAKAAGVRSVLFLPEDHLSFYGPDYSTKLGPDFTSSTHLETLSLVLKLLP